MNGIDVQEDEFEKMTPDLKMLVIYRNVRATRDQCNCREGKCNRRFDEIDKQINRRKFWNAAASAGGGIVGGFIAILLKLRFWQ